MIHKTVLTAATASALVLSSPAVDRSEISPAFTPASGLTASQVCHQGPGGPFQAEYPSCAGCKAAGYAARPDGRFVCVPVAGTDRYALGVGPVPDDTPSDDSNRL